MTCPNEVGETLFAGTSHLKTTQAPLVRNDDLNEACCVCTDASLSTVYIMFLVSFHKNIGPECFSHNVARLVFHLGLFQ